MTTEQMLIAAISVLWGVLVTFTTAVIRYFREQDRRKDTKIEALETKLDLSNQASRDLILLQAEFLRGKGVQIVTTPTNGR